MFDGIEKDNASSVFNHEGHDCSICPARDTCPSNAENGIELWQVFRDYRLNASEALKNL